MRVYDEPIDVVTAGVGSEEARPRAFVWRGRRYEVSAILDRWVVRRPWWRAALDPELGGLSALAPAALQKEVWRVLAVGESGASAGTYDLARGATWCLVRLAD